jgi:hypothetical protein
MSHPLPIQFLTSLLGVWQGHLCTISTPPQFPGWRPNDPNGCLKHPAFELEYPVPFPLADQQGDPSMFATVKMRLSPIADMVRSNGWKSVLREAAFLNRRAIVVEKDLSEVVDRPEPLESAQLDVVGSISTCSLAHTSLRTTAGSSRLCATSKRDTVDTLWFGATSSLGTPGIGLRNLPTTSWDSPDATCASPENE